jgi:ADP-dependent NAD(P)H-hydrate dehydratase
MMADKTEITDLPRLPKRQPAAHKGDFGLALLVGGSRGMAGAVALAGMAALHGGAGLVRLAVPDVCLDTVAGFEPSYMTVPLSSDRRGRIGLDALGQILQHSAGADVVALGPGMGRSLGLDTLVARLYETLPQPMVVDADALNALAARPEALTRPAGPRILTPHPGEFERLAGTKPTTESERIAAAAELAQRFGVVVVLKGQRTVIADGKRTAINTSGNPGMATGGSGDVLTGLVAAMVGRGLAPFEAAQLAVYVHGLAGDIAADDLGQESLTARNLIEMFPAAFWQYRDTLENSRPAME